MRGSLRSVGVILLLLIFPFVPVFSAAEPPAIAPSLMPLNPDVIDRAMARGEKIPFSQTEANFVARGARRINAPAESSTPLNQTVKALVILVKFTNTPPGGPATRYAPAVFDSMLFGRTYIRGGADPTTDRTLRNYYSEVSYGTVDVVTVNMPGSVGWVTAPNNYAYYCQADGIHDNGWGPYPRNVQRLVMDAVQAADPLVDFASYAVGGVVRNLFIVHAGSGAEWNGYSTLIWSHAWSIAEDDGWGTTPPALYADGVRISGYSMEPECGGNTTGEGGSVTGPWLPTVGVYAHEFGHVLGLPDEYDYGYESEGTGRFSLMAGGSWNASPNVQECSANSPAHLSPWGKARLGFVTPVEVAGSLLSQPIPPIETTNVGSLYKLTNPSSSGKEYWLVENRQQVGFDEGFVSMTADGHGIVIYHVDDNVFDRTYWNPNEAECVSGGIYRGTNNCDCATLPPNAYNGEKWYGISVEQADGQYHIERGLSRGFWQDFFNSITGKTAFTEATTPNTTSYYGCATRVAVTGVSGSTGTMTANLFGPTSCQVSPASIDFGTVLLGEVLDRSFTVTNEGGGVLSGIVAESCADYSILSGGGSYNLSAGQSVSVTVRFAPSTTGTKTCTLATGSPLCGNVSLTGFGDNPPPPTPGACCSRNAYCRILPPARCLALRGVFVGGVCTASVDPPCYVPGSSKDNTQPPDFVIVEPPVGVLPLSVEIVPNPGTSQCRVRFTLGRETAATVEVFDLAGARVRVLARGSRGAGEQTVAWDGQSDDGQALPAGVYFVRVTTAQESTSERVVLTR